MLNILSSRTTESNRQFREVPRQPGENNVGWIRRVAGVMGGGDESRWTDLVLLGGVSSCAFRLRVAQSHIRHDLTPSHWSHVLLLAGPADGEAKETPTLEISLEPERGFGFPPVDNAVQDGRLGVYRMRSRYPNIALIRIPVPRADIVNMLRKREHLPEGRKERKEMVADFRRQRASIDAVDLLLTWLGFAWGVGGAGNPLLQGHGIPSAALIEVALAACKYDMTPGLENRSSCPEAIWQAARWWHEYYEHQEKVAPIGAWIVGQILVNGVKPRQSRNGKDQGGPR